MPPKIMQLVHSQISADRQTAWVLLAVEVAGSTYYLDENICERVLTTCEPIRHGKVSSPRGASCPACTRS
jgi:hypothetical protein